MSLNPKSVIPLESNPEIFTQFAHRLGLLPILSFHDIYSISEPDLILMLPRPIYSIILLFPITEDYEKEKKEQDNQQVAVNGEIENHDNVNWFPQIIRNSCGFYALLHALSNISNNLISKDSLLDRFLNDLLQDGSNSTKLIEDLIFSSNNLYQDYSHQGQTEAPPLEESVDLHFITFVKKGKYIYELDGRRKSYLKLGEASNTDTENPDIIEEPLIRDKLLHYMDLADDENKLKFSMIGLGASFDD